MNGSTQASRKRRASDHYKGNIVAFGRENIRKCIEQRVLRKFQRKLTGVGPFRSLLIHFRIAKIVGRKMKAAAPLHCLYTAR
jgi:hypothetical protein